MGEPVTDRNPLENADYRTLVAQINGCVVCYGWRIVYRLCPEHQKRLDVIYREVTRE